MDSKKSPNSALTGVLSRDRIGRSKFHHNRRTKRSKGVEENYWDCSVCTYRNSAEAFKCLMCDIRKGTSTRKPRINPQLVAQQVAQQYPQPQPKPKTSKSDKKLSDKSHKKSRPRLKNVDRSLCEHNAVTVNNLTVIITEFQPLRPHSSSSSGHSTDSSSHSDHSTPAPLSNGELSAAAAPDRR